MSTEGVVVLVSGLVLGMVGALLVNLLTPTVQNWLARRSAKRALARAEKLEEELRQLAAYRDSVPDLVFFGIRFLESLVLGGFSMMMTMFLLLASREEPPLNFEGVFLFFGLSTSVVGLLFGLISMRHHFTLWKLIQFKEYKERTESVIERLKTIASSQ